MFTGVTAGSVAFAASYDDEYGLEDKLDRYCGMTDEEKQDLISKYDKSEEHIAKIDAYCELDEDKRAAYIEEHKDEFRMQHDKDLRDKLDRYCGMTDEEKQDLISKYDKSEEHIAKIDAYCELDEDKRAAYIEEHKDEFRMQHDKDLRDMIDRYCEMTDEDKRAFLAEHDKVEDHATKMNEYCELDEDGRMKLIEEYKDKYKSQMTDKMTDFKKEHMMNVDEMQIMHKEIRDQKDYSRYCDMTDEKRAMSIDDNAKLERISEWCAMTLEERADFMMKHRDAAMDFKEKRQAALERMKEKQDLSPRLRTMIMEKHDISDDRMDEIKMKYKEKYGDFTDQKRTDLKIEFDKHMALVKIKMSDERKSAIHDRVAEMKVFKAELRENSDMTDEEKQGLRAEFIEKAKDMQLAWISPRHQMHAGIDAADIECREGFSHVMKASNGVAMCLKADTALKMIDRGIAVPAN